MGPPQPGATLFSQWAATAMQQSPGGWAPPMGQATCSSMQPASAWQMKVIRCLDKKIRAYQPDYAPEDEDDDEAAEDENGWSVKVNRGTVRRGKKGKAMLRPAKRDFAADASFDAWMASGEENEMGRGPTA